jgi:prevent-host-death family protein
MKTISASEFKARCLALLDEVDPEGIIVTKRGKPVAKLVPIGQTAQALIGCMRGKIKRNPTDDLLSTGVKWKLDVES